LLSEVDVRAVQRSPQVKKICLQSEWKAELETGKSGHIAFNILTMGSVNQNHGSLGCNRPEKMVTGKINLEGNSFGTPRLWSNGKVDRDLEITLGKNVREGDSGAMIKENELMKLGSDSTLPHCRTRACFAGAPNRRPVNGVLQGRGTVLQAIASVVDTMKRWR
jgi:hypothetical protein